MEILGPGTVLGVVGAAAAGALAKWIDSRVKLKTKQIDVGSELRDDLWEQVRGCEERLKAAQCDCDEWRKRYYDQYESFIEQRRELRRYQDKFGPLERSDISSKRDS